MKEPVWGAGALNPAPLEEFSLSWALVLHLSQGSLSMALHPITVRPESYVLSALQETELTHVCSPLDPAALHYCGTDH